MYDRDICEPGPCPVCGKLGGAFMGSSTWGHDELCCGDECGLKMRDRLNALEADTEYLHQKNIMLDSMGRLAQMRQEAISSFRGRDAENAAVARDETSRGVDAHYARQTADQSHNDQSWD